MNDPVGSRFGRFTVIGTEVVNQRTRWRCRCDCGNERLLDPCSLRRGNSKSCGCLRSEVISRLRTQHGHARHGAVSSEYGIWRSMKERCYRETNKRHKNYGNRGIEVCERWRSSFELFLEDMGKRPSASHSIDRINNDGDYCPENCRWADKFQQARNRTSSRILTHEGVSLSVTEWAGRIGISPDTIFSRLRRGASISEALSPALKRPATKFPANRKKKDATK